MDGSKQRLHRTLSSRFVFLVEASPLVTAGEAEVFLPSYLVLDNLKTIGGFTHILSL